ncbi:hypothetical protein AB0395_32215 [Streptosporangium sp. NPDC051023]|uniref:DUF6896 domain-containing protein n=1 Tax=Streptosporangium sp. NPDC051023 TaxID=3155410 RepID=UPI00344C2409
MATQGRDVIEAALASFAEAKAAIEETFGVVGAPEIVNAVLAGSRPRQGRCTNGLEYFVHGIGYTVVFPDDAQVHIDGDESGDDVFSLYDMLFFLENSGKTSPSAREVQDLLDELVASDQLRRAGGDKFVVST